MELGANELDRQSKVGQIRKETTLSAQQRPVPKPLLPPSGEIKHPSDN